MPSRWPLIAKITFIVNGFLIVAVTSTGLATYRVARDAIRQEIVAGGMSAAGDFARSNALEFLDPDTGPLELQLRLGQLIGDERSGRVLAAYAMDRSTIVIAHAGGSVPLPTEAIIALEQADVVNTSDRSILVATPVRYDGVVLGHVAFALDGALIAEAGKAMVIQVVVVVTAFILLNILGLWILVRGMLKPVVTLGEAADAFAAGDYRHPLPSGLPEDEIGRATRSFKNMREALTVHMRFSNAALIDRIRAGNLMERGDEHQLTVIFGDAVNYTSWAGSLPPEVIFSTLSRYYTCMGRIMVKDYGGIIDKFIGDGVMAHFGLMRSGKGHPPGEAVLRDHVRAALRGVCYSQIALRALSYSIERFERRPSLIYRFGMASGRCLVGPLGARDVMLDYTVIGNVVNLASRLEHLAPPSGLVIDRFTLMDAGESFLETKSGGIQNVKGCAAPVPVFNVRRISEVGEHERMRAYLLNELMTDSFITSVILNGDMNQEKVKEVRLFLETEISERPFLPANHDDTPFKGSP